MSKIKPDRGTLICWKRKYYTEDKGPYKPEIFGPNLGYIILGTFKGHPVFHGNSGHTSLVVKHTKKGRVETLNSIYHVDGPEFE